jgi:hypothetical protein
MIPGGRSSASLFHVKDRNSIRWCSRSSRREAKKNYPRRQEAFASLFHVRERDKVCCHEVTEQQELGQQRQR